MAANSYPQTTTKVLVFVLLCTSLVALWFGSVQAQTELSLEDFENEPRIVMEERHIDPEFEEDKEPEEFLLNGWKRSERLDKDEQLILTLVLNHNPQGLATLEEIFWRVSDPKDPEYGDHLSLEEIAELVAPEEDYVQHVLDFVELFQGVSVDPLPIARDFIRVHLPTSSAERMLQCTFYKYTHSEAASMALSRCDGDYSLPSSVAEAVAFVGGVSHFPSVRRARIATDSSAGLTVNPDLIRKRYNIGDTLGGQSPNTSQAVAQFLGQYYSQGDLDEFFDLFFTPARGDAPTVVGPNDQAPGMEASLDIEYIMSIGAKISTQFWSNEEQSSNQEPFLDWMLYVNNDTNAPLLFSVSYGDTEKSRSLSYCNRVNAEFIKAGARGISILFAAGDSGVGNGGPCKKFVPDYPASSPYITTVGGTQLGLFESGEEVVWPDGGGGFSNYWPRPSYQDDAVNDYLQNAGSNLPSESVFNVSGRAYPDVAALASGFIVVINRIPTPGVGGTSCATPTFSGVISLLNDLRLSQGKSPLGFLNPWLYQQGAENPQIFNDITSGSNPACGTDGFPAIKGWDASSGWGSPLYDAMSQVVLAMEN